MNVKKIFNRLYGFKSNRTKKTEIQEKNISTPATVTAENSGDTFLGNMLEVPYSETDIMQFVGENGDLIFLEPETILKDPQLAFLVTQIKEKVGLQDKYFETYYLPAILEMTRLCQSVAASHEHHHCEPYGLIEHSLEVANYAVAASQNEAFFPDGHVESIQWEERVYMYCCFLSGLLHDAAKLLTNFKFEQRSKKGDWILFNPILHAIPTQAESVEYRIRPLVGSHGVYAAHQSTHEVFSHSMLQAIVPFEGLEWIISYSNRFGNELWVYFIHSVASDYSNGGEIGAVVSKADQYSTSKNLAEQKHYMANNPNKKDVYIDLSDPNLSLHKAVLSILREIARNPGAYNVVTNKAAMGKFSHVERYGDLIFFSVKSVMPILTKRLTDQGVKLPNDQMIFTNLVDNFVTIPAPSGDTFWWCEFFSPNNNNASREMSYFVVNIDTLSDINIDDLRSYEVEITLTDKSLCLDSSVGEDECEAHLLEFNEENYPEIWTMLHQSEFELIDKLRDKASSKKSERLDKAAEGDQLASEPEATQHQEPSVEVISSESVTPNVSALDISQSDPSQLVKYQKTAVPPQPAAVPPQPAAVPPQPAEVPPQPAAVPPKPGAVPRKNAADSGKKKNRQRKKANQNKGDTLSKALSVGLGFGCGDVESAKKKVTSTNQSKEGQSSITIGAQEEAKPVKPSPQRIQVAPEVPAFVDYDDSGDIYYPDPANNTHQPADNFTPVAFHASPVEKLPRPEMRATEEKINLQPQALEVNDTIVKLLGRNHGLYCPSGYDVYDLDSEQENLTSLICTWYPYFESCINDGIISYNEPDAEIWHIAAGLFFSKSRIEAKFSNEMCSSLFALLAASSATLVKGGEPVISITFDDGAVDDGYIVTVRGVMVNGVNIPLFKGAKLS